MTFLFYVCLFSHAFSLKRSMHTYNKVNFEAEITKLFSTVLQKRKKEETLTYGEMTSHSCLKS